MTRDQYRCYWPITEIQQEKRYHSHSEPIYENDLTQDNSNKYIIGRNYKDLS